MIANSDEVVAYYDSFSQRQIKTGINIRHRLIVARMTNAGLKRDHHVLEIGCGIGSITGLLSKYLTKGKVVGVDISAQSIAFARKKYSARKNTTFVLSDIVELGLEDVFDFIVLPDVLEHIPVENHAAIFRKIRHHVKDSSMLFVHIPHQRYLEYLAINHPEQLQIIDQPIESGDIITTAEKAGFELVSFEAYSIATVQGDYRRMVFKVKEPISKFNQLPWITKAWRELLMKFF